MYLNARPPYRLAASLLTLTAALTGCGGGTEKTPSTPPPSGQISVNFVSPAETNNVHDLGAPIPLLVNVNINGNFAPNGTPVTLTLDPSSSASVAPTAPTTANGIAAAELRSRTLGRMTARAMAMSSSYTASDELTLYIRPTPKDLGVLVPAYFSAGTKSPWVDLIYASKVSHPDVAVTAIVKPATGVDTNGIVTAADADLSTNITDFTASANHKVIAYVSTISGSGTRSVADIKAIINSYISYYPKLNGFFLDEMGTGTSQRPFYSDIYTYIKGLAPTMEVMGNPGTFPDSSYAEPATIAADVLVTFEGNAASYQNIDPQPSSTWIYSKPNSAQAMLVHSASTCTAMQEALKTAAAARTNTGWVYVTDQPVGSPWSALPSYWTKLLGTVDARNKNRTLPAC